MEMHTPRAVAKTPQAGLYGRDFGVESRLTTWIQGLIRVIGQRVEAAFKEMQYRRACQELRALDDRLLRDIGLDRSEIHFAVRHGRPFDRRSRRAR